MDINYLTNNERVRLALQGGVIGRILDLSERLNLKLFRSKTLYRITDKEYQPEYGFTPYQKIKGLIALLHHVKPERTELIKADLFAGLSEREKRLPFSVWVEWFCRISGEVTAAAVADKRELIRLKMAELMILARTEWA